MRVKYCCDAKAYENYYLSQVGHGMPYFSGARVQQGYGLGNMFNSIDKSVFFDQKRCQNPQKTSFAKRCQVCFQRLTGQKLQVTSTWWCSPLPCTGEGRNGLSIPRGSHPWAILPWTIFFVFYTCCPMCGHIWIAFLNPIDCPPISSTFFPKTFLSLFFHPIPLLNISHSPLILILMLLLISGDIHPNPGPIDPCSVCSRRVTWETDRYNVPTVLSGYTSPAFSR